MKPEKPCKGKPVPGTNEFLQLILAQSAGALKDLDASVLAVRRPEGDEGTEGDDVGLGVLFFDFAVAGADISSLTGAVAVGGGGIEEVEGEELGLLPRPEDVSGREGSGREGSLKSFYLHPCSQRNGRLNQRQIQPSPCAFEARRSTRERLIHP